jgi:DNA-binding SARP family transcriptional activator
MTDTIQLSLLGSVQVLRNGVAVRGFESRKALALLCYLVVRGQVVHRSHLADLFWQDKPEHRGRGNLSRVLHNLTSLLPGCLHATRDTVMWAPAGECWVDTTVFAGLAARADAPSLMAAAELYRGDLVSGLYLDDCPEFETWLAAEQELWRQRMAQVLEQAIALHRNEGNYRESLRYAARWVSLDPWREESHRVMMLLLALSGQRSAALKQYATCQRILASELDVAPAEATTRLYRQILAGEVRARRPASPPETTSPEAIGSSRLSAHTTDLAQIIDRLGQPECRLLSLVGSDDRGMADLGRQAATNQSSHFRDGICFVEDAAAPERANMTGALALALHLTVQGPAALPGAIFAHLRDREMLLCFSSFANRPPNIGLLEDILKRAPHVKIMLTAHAPVNSWAEWIYDVFPAHPA